MPLQDKTREHFFRDLISVDDLLSDLTPRLQKDLAIIEKPLSVSSNKVLFAMGSEPLCIYVHRTGRVALFQDDDLKDIALACPVGPKCIYGLVEALSGTAYGATMKTITVSEFDMIDREELLRFIRNQPALCFRLAEILSRLYRQALNSIKAH